MNYAIRFKYAVTVPRKLLLTWARLLLEIKVVRKLVLGIKGETDCHQVNIVTGEATVIDKKYGEMRRGDLGMRRTCCFVPVANAIYSSHSGVDGMDYWTP